MLMVEEKSTMHHHTGPATTTEEFSNEFSNLNGGLAHNRYTYCYPTDKNRYSSIVPVESTRVRLKTVEGIPYSDYINANYIAAEIGGRVQANYIACQAPLESTNGDFWRMIWEQNCGVIVMVTRLYEGHSQKSACYWPEEGNVQCYGRFLVCHKRSFSIGDITIRSLLVRPADDDRCPTREIIQIYYGEWPDFDAPSSTKPVRDLLILMNKFQERSKGLYGLGGPMVVHCSAGIGRTGSLITCHIVLEKLKHSEFPNIKHIVESMRLQRHHTMVKNEKQYEFIFKVSKDIVRDLQLSQEKNGLMT